MTKDNSPSTPYVPLFFSAMKSAKLFTSQSLDAPAIVFHRVSFEFYVVGFC
jgi:hypothetical protein